MSLLFSIEVLSSSSLFFSLIPSVLSTVFRLLINFSLPPPLPSPSSLSFPYRCSLFGPLIDSHIHQSLSSQSNTLQYHHHPLILLLHTHSLIITSLHCLCFTSLLPYSHHFLFSSSIILCSHALPFRSNSELSSCKGRNYFPPSSLFFPTLSSSLSDERVCKWREYLHVIFLFHFRPVLFQQGVNRFREFPSLFSMRFSFVHSTR